MPYDADVGGGEAALGNTAKSVDQEARENRSKAQRMLDFQHQRVAAKILPRERVGLCRWTVISKTVPVGVVITTYQSKDGPTERASFEGLQTCGSVWLCPCCGRRISESRRGELNHLLAWARAQGLQPVMLTLTSRHKLGDNLSAQLKAMKVAKRRLRQRREWRAIKGQIVGTVTATEVTYGASGWHTHFHELVLVRAETEAKALVLFKPMPRVWQSCLRGLGLDATLARGFQAQGAAVAGSYFAKWGAGEELALALHKGGREGGRTPRQLLADAAAGNDGAALLWGIYGRAFKGARQLVWSPGLKAAAGVGDVSDEDVAQDAAPEQERRRVTEISYGIWQDSHGLAGAKRRRGRILDAAEIVGEQGVWRVIAAGGTDPPANEDPDLDLIE